MKGKMLEVRIGTDIIEVSRIRNAIKNNGEAFLNRVFTKNEIIYCESKKIAKYQHYAGRFAGKEAVFKAVSNNIVINEWKDIEISNLSNGKPDVFIKGQHQTIDLSISHCKEYATAVAIYTK